MSDDVRREPESDAESVVRRSVEDWNDVAIIMTGTNATVEGDGLTQTATSLQPGENAVLEIVHKGETVARFIPDTNPSNSREAGVCDE